MSQNVCEVVREVGGPLPSHQGQANTSCTDGCGTDAGWCVESDTGSRSNPLGEKLLRMKWSLSEHLFICISSCVVYVAVEEEEHTASSAWTHPIVQLMWGRKWGQQFWECQNYSIVFNYNRSGSALTLLSIYLRLALSNNLIPSHTSLKMSLLESEHRISICFKEFMIFEAEMLNTV